MQDPTTFTRRSWLATVMAAGMLAASCVGGAESSEDFLDELVEPVTDVSHTDVRRQSIGNCWSYASTGWLESLHRARTEQSVNVSESWITFWDWHRKITGQAPGGVTRNATSMRDEVSTGGWWDTAVTILRDRGVVMEAEFIPEEANAERSTRQSDALAAINNELNGEGRLATPAARRDPQIVLNVLFDAWRINDDIRAEIRRVYGISARTLLPRATVTPPAWMRRATAFPIRTMVARSATAAPTRFDGFLSDVIPGGRYAWRSASYPTTPSSRVALQRRIMRSLNAAQPVIVSWLVDFNALNNAGAFTMTQLRTAGRPGRQGGHMTVLHDYQVRFADGSVLPAGTPASPADRERALTGTVEFLRVKNSWGVSRSDRASMQGYYDLHLDYLHGPISWVNEARPEFPGMQAPLNEMILPPGF